MSESNGYDVHAVFALSDDGLAWMRCSATRGNPAGLREFILEKEELRYKNPEEVHIVRGDGDRHLCNPFIPSAVFDRLVRDGKLRLID